MTFTKIIGICRVAVVTAAAAFLAGCASSGPRPWNLSITKTTPASIEVDLIGVTDAEKPYWEGYNLDKYWSDGDLRRQNAHPLTHILELGKSWEVASTNANWSQWLSRGDTQLLVIANLPGHFDAGPADPRRLFLPLGKVWQPKKDGTLEIEVQDTLIMVNTPQKQ